MSSSSQPEREIQALRERIAALSSAILRVNASLDVDTVLHEIAESARALTGARFAVIVTIDEARALEDAVTSGFTPDERRQVEGWTDSLRVFEALRDVPSPLRVADLPTFIASMGFNTEGVIVNTFLGTPMHHRGVQVGNFFLGEKQTGPEFTGEDEEVLALFAAQAASAVANARTHRAEQGARADLEALIETSPVGVVVFDARSGRPVSMNREARRLASGLLQAGRPAEDLVQTATCRFSDGSEIVLSELTLPQALAGSRTLRAEEVVTSVPDGRSITTLVNVTPIPGGDGEVKSVVITLQDLAPLQELERLQADFLGMVSHELRGPLTSIKGSAATLLEDSEGLDPAERHEFHRIIEEQADHMRGLIGDLLDAGRIEAGTLSVAPEPSEMAALIEGARSTFLSAGGRHTVLIDLPPDLPRVMADRRRIVQVLNNLLFNAARHSPDSAPIRVEAERDGSHVAVSVQDEGRGVAPERLPHMFRRYAPDDEGGGRAADGMGLGLIICRGLVEAHGGRIRAESGGIGQGARFTFTVPVAGDAWQSDPAGDRGAASGTAPAAGETARILVVDDDPQTLRYVRHTLTVAGYAVAVTGDQEQLSRTVRAERPHLVLLDLVLHDADGIELMGSVPELAGLPVVFISGYGRDETIAEALRAGATDYLVKPFSPTELTARVGAALRRATRPEPFVLGDLAIHYGERRVTVAGRPVELTAKEYELLRVLSQNAGHVVAYDALLGQVWSGRQAGGVNLVRNFVRKLRAKLGDDAHSPAWIFSVRSVGYRMPDPRDA